jgi:hypothetical protein
MARVHSYKHWVTARDRYVTTRLKGTPTYIAAIHAEIMLNTEQDVDPSEIDDKGRYDPETHQNHNRITT